MSRRFLASLFAMGVLVGGNSAFAAGYTIGLSMHFMRDDYAEKLVQTVKAVAAQHPGSKVIVTDANAEPQKQLADMENLEVQNVDAIIVVPIDEKAILPAITRANARRIPIVAITKIPGADVLTTIGANGDYANGRVSGKLMVRATGGKGKLAVIDIPYKLWRIDQREKGFMDTIKNSDLKVVAKQSGMDQAKIQDTVSGILIAHPDLAGIWCTFSNQLVGAADALRMANRKDVILTGIDADKAIMERIKSGWISGTAAQFPAAQGRLAAQAVFDHFAGKPVAAEYDVPVKLVTPDNVDAMRRKIWSE
jgi:ribose transport system substrate-binding protein